MKNSLDRKKMPKAKRKRGSWYKEYSRDVHVQIPHSTLFDRAKNQTPNDHVSD